MVGNPDLEKTGGVGVAFGRKNSLWEWLHANAWTHDLQTTK